MPHTLSFREWLSGHWTAVHVSAAAAAVLQATLLLQAVSRGLDYVGLPTDIAIPTLSVIERALPLTVSGWAFLLFGLAGLTGLLLPQWPVTAYSHVGIATMYSMFAAGAILDIAGREPTQGWRTATAWMVGAVGHAVFAHLSASAWRVARVQ